MFSAAAGREKEKKKPLAPGGEAGCQLCGWLIRPDNDACPCPPPRTRMASALGGGRRLGGGEGGLKRLRPQRSEVADEMEVERRNKKISGGKDEEAAR